MLHHYNLVQSAMDGENKICVICDNPIINEKIINVTEKGKNSLREIAVLKSDKKLAGRIDSGDPIFLHSECRRNYTNRKYKRYFESNKKPGEISEPKKLRSSSSAFNWEDNCFFCGNFVECDSVTDDRSDCHFVRTLSFMPNILEKCDERNDEWALQVKGRLQSCIDLVAADALYHKNCQAVFMTGKKATSSMLNSEIGLPGRPRNEEMEKAFLGICDWLELMTNELFSLDEVRNEMIERYNLDDDVVYSKRWLKTKLISRYNDHIFFAHVDGKKDVVCFKNFAQFIINTKWYENRKDDFEEEKIRLITAATKIIAAEMREKTYDSNNYPTPENISDIEYGKKWLPPSLCLFLEKLIPSDVKIIAIGQAILKASRPKGLIPPIMLGIGVEMDHKFGSKWLINELYRLGFSVSYDEVKRYKLSAIESECTRNFPNHFPGNFTQWVADNVDHNIVTLDGKGTFHGMGIISASTKSSLHQKSLIPRLTGKLSVEKIVSNKGIPIFPYYNEKDILSGIKLKPMLELQFPYVLPPSINLHLLWQVGFHDSSRPGWFGFMHDLSASNSPPAAHEIIFLPLISLSSSDKNCIYSTLLFIIDQATKLNVKTPCVTFDQPLWIKAFEITQGKNLDIVCRLGGFHMLMSFIGSIGNFMSGSGIEEIFQIFYAENTVPYIMNGKAIARAIRAHFIVQAALYQKLLERAFDKDEKLERIRNTYAKIASKQETMNNEETASVLFDLETQLKALKDGLANSSRTAALWLQYVDYVDIIKIFINAERTANWSLHLIAVSKMLNIFAATGHTQYAKCTRLYLQNMQDLSTTHPWLHNEFFNKGNHAARRTGHDWSGLWTDLLIEQTLMRTLKTRGGLTDGRGMSESTQLIWVHSMHSCATIHDAVTQLTKNFHVTSNQHVEMGNSRIIRDNKDFQSVVSYFNDHNPFDENDDRLRSLSTGLFAGEKDGINCDRIEEIGQTIQSKLDDISVSSFSIKKIDHVKNLKSLQNHIKVDGNILHVDNSILFWRLITVAERDEDPKNYFKFELTAEPAALFKDTFMRKPDKSSLVQALLKSISLDRSSSSLNCNTDSSFTSVIDGGCLLHSIRWSGKTYGEVVEQYSKHIRQTNQGKVFIVFDGYESSTKDEEHRRRTSIRSSPSVKVTKGATVHHNQSAFLANTSNKIQFIQMLGQNLRHDGHEVVMCDADADVDIVSTALKLAKNGKKKVSVIAEDTDILILLLHHYEEVMNDIYLSSYRKSKTSSVLNIRIIKEKLKKDVSENLLFIHAMSGCDTTSAPFGLGKSGMVKMFLSPKQQLLDICKTMYNENSSVDEVGNAGIQFFIISNHGKPNDDMTAIRFNKYMQLVSTSTSKPVPQKLPPTERSAYFHALRVHLQVMQWKKLNNSCLDPCDWGWTVINGRHIPKMCDMEPAPDDLLKIVRCQCKNASNLCGRNTCSCRKHGLKCVAACGNCHGTSCQNAKELEFDSEDEDLM